MDVLNKLYCTVSSTVSQFSTVLPGNPVTREYEATNHIASAGPSLLWKIFSGFKKSTHQEASIFLLEKKQLDRLTKNDREAVLDSLRKSISQLSRLRHPQILVVQHTLEESRDSLAFATEPVFASLANILGKVDNVPVPVPPQIDNFNLFEVEIKYGLLQVAEGLSFLHNDVKLLHRNLCPHNIIINKEGAWKIFGFDYSAHCISGSEAIVRWPTIEFAVDVHALAQPDLDFIAPESGLSGTLLPSSDIFSFGMLIFSLYNKGQPLQFNNSNWTTFNQSVSKLKRISNNDLHSVPPAIRDIAKMMLNYVPELRPDLHEFLKSEFFEDIGVKTLSYLDSLFQWDNLQKSQFYKGLPTVIEKLPQRVGLFRIIPCLSKEFVNPTMVPFVLPSVFAIAEGCTKEEFTQYILSYLKPVLKMQEPVQILLICMQKMELLLKLTPADDVKSDVLPLLFRSLESNSQQLQELCLSVIPTFATLIDYPAMKNALIPRIKKLCIATSHTSVRVNCLVCLGKLMEYLDKWLILDDVIPFLPKIKSREPAVLMSIVGIYKIVLSHKKITIPKEVMAGQILPFLIPLSIENSLTLNQFNAVIVVVKDMVAMVENEHRAKLEQLSSIQEQQRSLDISASSIVNGFDATSSSASKQNDDFHDLFKAKSPDPPSRTESKPLNFQEKQNLSRQNELHQRLQMEPTITPTPVLSSRSSNAPKDLTASLIDSNLKQMNFNQTNASTKKAFPSSSFPTTNSASPSSFPASGFSPAANYSMNSTNLSMNSTNLGMNSTNLGMNSTNLSMNSVRPPPQTTNLPTSSFSSTNPAGLAPAAFFRPSYTSPIPPTAASMQSKQPAKQLTFSEINDFLN